MRSNKKSILILTVEVPIDFFPEEKKIVERLLPLQKVGLGYIGLGQSSNTLSGGEAQRVKLAYFLSKEHKTKNCIFIFDEPTTGLHFHDIRKLMESLQTLVDEGGHTVMIIEHNLEVVKCADWVIDLGPDGGDKGGNLCFAGTPEDMVKSEKGYTAKYLKGKV